MNQQPITRTFPNKAYFTISEAAAILGVSWHRISDLCQLVSVPGYSKKKVPRSEIDRVLGGGSSEDVPLHNMPKGAQEDIRNAEHQANHNKEN